jgi:hypothetical protein
MRLPKMPAYYRHAVAIAAAVRDVPGIEVVPEPVQSPMMHLRFSASLDAIRERVVDIARTEKVWTFARPWAALGPKLQEFEFSVGDATLELSPEEIRDLFIRMVGTPRKSTRRSRR